MIEIRSNLFFNEEVNSIEICAEVFKNSKLVGYKTFTHFGFNDNEMKKIILLIEEFSDIVNRLIKEGGETE